MKSTTLCLGLLCFPALCACQQDIQDTASGTSTQQASSTQPSKSSDSTNTQDTSSPAPFFRIVDHVASGGGCRMIPGDENATALITNSYPDGPKDYAQWTFDDLAAPSVSGRFDQVCELTLTLAWTPGYRIKSSAMEMELWANGPLDTEFGLDLGFSNRPPHRVRTALEHLKSSARMRLSHGADLSSDCSGQGTWHAKIHLSVSSDDHEKSSLEIDQASILFSLAEQGEVEACPPAPATSTQSYE